ncbi:MAG: response regulator [Candidatus Methylomirabilales bacterium]
MHRPVPILVVDNDEDAREGLCRLLRHDGYIVDAAADGMQALDRVERRPYALVITDMLMPRVGGLVLLGRLRKTRPRLPVLLITAFGDWDSYARALELGVTAYLTKPFRSDELLEAVRRALEESRRGVGAPGREDSK